MTDDQLKKLPTDDKGRYAVSVDADSLVEALEIHRRLERVEVALGLSKCDISEVGDTVYSLVNKLMLGRLNCGTRKSEDEFEYLCDLLSKLSALDFQLLKDHWTLKYTPKRIEQALYVTAKNSTRPGLPRNLAAAISNMSLLSHGPEFKIPTSR